MAPIVPLSPLGVPEGALVAAAAPGTRLPDAPSQEDEEAIDAWTEEIAAELLAVQ